MNQLVKNKRFLTILNVIVVSSLIFFNHIGLFGSSEWFGFLLLSTSVLVLAIYKPVIVFALLVGVIPIEIINIVPEMFGFELRPYQFLTVVLIIALILRVLFGVETHGNVSVRKRWSIFDTLIVIFVGLGFVTYLMTPLKGSLKGSLIVLSFALLYFVVRYFVRSRNDVLSLFPILISGGAVVGVYAIIQNVLFLSGGKHAEVMPGRPNATFTEPDWLAMYIVFCIATALTYLYYSAHHKHIWKFFDIALYGVTTIFFTTLIITVARSAWLGAGAVMVIYLLILFLQKKYKLFAVHAFWIGSAGLLSLIIVWGFHLTNFELLNRAQSTGSGLQEITISCISGQTQGTALTDINVGTSLKPVPTVIENTDELAQYNCRHINLEEIESEKLVGNEVLKIYRKDPNVAVRADVYSRALILIKQQPLTGYGWGSSGMLLGSDENGTPLNASNMFLETALSIGVVGGVVLILIFLLAFVFAIKLLRHTTTSRQKAVAIFVMIGSIAVIVPNLFNAGLFLGFVWLFFGLLVDSVRKVW